MKENYHHSNKVFTTIIVVFLLVFFCACSTKKQLTSSRNTAVAVDTATDVSTSAFRSIQHRQPYYYSHFPNQFQFKPLPPAKVLTTKDKYEIAFENLQNMLNGNEAIDFEKAIFISENVYYQNKVSYDDYLKVLDWHTKRIKALIAANDKSDTMDFTTYTNFRERGLSYTSLRYTEKEKRELYRKALSNWAIFTYLTDTLTFGKKEQLPFAYKIEDPFGMYNWSNSQVLHLLGSMDKKGNCFALVALFKILSNRLNTEAYICTAPQHIYLQHRDVKGDFYNLELATGSYPSDGTLMTLTFTYKEAIMSGISLRRLKQDKQNIVLCLVNLGKSYEHKFQTKEDTFMLKCADLALQHDSLNLNAMLLKQQVLEERVMKYVTENNITNLTAINTLESYKQLEKHTLYLYDKGYRQMPLYMQEIILSKLRKDNKPIVIKDRTPNPFTSIKVPAKNRRYSTLSGGLYEEVHETKQLEQFGYFVLDTKLRKLVKIEPNYNKDLLIDPVVFAWQIDPMTNKQASWSPYVAFNNNPIINIDNDGNYAVSVHYNITYNTLIKLGYSKDVADNIAHHASVYADHPEIVVLNVDNALHGSSNSFRPNINYSKTQFSQAEWHSDWHSMMSNKEAESGMTHEDAMQRGLSFGWGNIFSQQQKEDIGKLGQGIHALQDAYAHKGASTDEHLGTNALGMYTKNAATMLYNDAYGNTDKAAGATKAAGVLLQLFKGNTSSLQNGMSLDFTGLSADQLKTTQGLFGKAGYSINEGKEKGTYTIQKLEKK